MGGESWMQKKQDKSMDKKIDGEGSTGSESWEDSGKNSETQRDTAEPTTTPARRDQTGKAHMETQVGQQSVTSPESVRREALNQMQATAPVPAFYSRLQPEYREKLMKHAQEIQAARDAFVLAGRAENKRSQKSPDEAENELGQKRAEMSGKPAAGGGGKPDQANDDLGKIFEMMRISHDRQLAAEIHTALLDIRDKLTGEEPTKIGKETLLLLKEVSSYKFQVLDDQQAGDDDDQKGEMAVDQTCLNANEKAVAKEMAEEAERFDSHRKSWEFKWGTTCSIFTEATLLSSMQFTHFTPGLITGIGCSTMETLQVISIQLTELANGLEFPLSVYGVVAVRDMVDHNRNILFSRKSFEAQEVKQDDNFLHFVGPSRAIVFTHEVWIEIDLGVKGRADSQLMSCARLYYGRDPGVSSICFKNPLCTLELCLQPVKGAVQATILGVQVAKDDGSWPFQYGGLVACSPQSGTLKVTDVGITREIHPSSTQIVMIESKDGAMPRGLDGNVLLRRQVVSVKLDGRLDVVIKSYSKSGGIAAETCVCFDPNVCNISRKQFVLGDGAQGAVIVAWSRVAASKTSSVEINVI